MGEEVTKKLYRVTLRGFDSGLFEDYKISYVIAEDPSTAVCRVQTYLEEKAVGHPSDRELYSVELLAEATEYPACSTQLFL